MKGYKFRGQTSHTSVETAVSCRCCKRKPNRLTSLLLKPSPRLGWLHFIIRSRITAWCSGFSVESTAWSFSYVSGTSKSNTHCTAYETSICTVIVNIQANTHTKFDIHMSVHHNIIPNYSQQDATFFYLFIFLQMLYMFQAVPPPIIRST